MVIICVVLIKLTERKLEPDLARYIISIASFQDDSDFLCPLNFTSSGISSTRMSYQDFDLNDFSAL